MLKYFDFEHDIIVKTEKFDYVSGGVLSWYDDSSILHSTAFFSRN